VTRDRIASEFVRRVSESDIAERRASSRAASPRSVVSFREEGEKNWRMGLLVIVRVKDMVTVGRRRRYSSDLEY